jgi:hypothetical protein
LQNAHRAVARLDLPGEIKGLNVSNAPVLALYVGATRLGLMGRPPSAARVLPRQLRER